MTENIATSEMRILSVEQLKFISDTAYQAGAAAEREACAQVLDEMANDMEREMEPSTAIAYVRSKAAAIRARGQA